MHKLLLAGTAALAALGPAACADRSAAPPPDAAAWRIDSLPLLELGTAEGDSTQQLYEVRGAVRLADGSVAIANRGTAQVLFYSAAGERVATAGRRGGGPGEFTSMGPIQALGDTVAVFDYESRHVTYFDRTGGLVRNVQLQTPEGVYPPQFVGQLANGRILAKALVARPLTGARTSGIRRDSVQLWLFDPLGVPVQQLGSFAGPALAVSVRTRGDAAAITLAYYPFYPDFIAATDGQRVVAAETDSARAFVFDGAGTAGTPLRWDAQPRPAPEDLLVKYEQNQLALLRDRSLEPELRRTVREIPRPALVPVIDRTIVDAFGWTWLREYDEAGEGASSWLIFPPDSGELRRVRAPRGLDITAAGKDWVLGIVTDDVGVEYVRLYRLYRN